MKTFQVIFISFLLFFICFSTKEIKTVNSSTNLDLTSHTNIVRIILHYLAFPDIQTILRCGLTDKKPKSKFLTNLICSRCKNKDKGQELYEVNENKEILISLSKFKTILNFVQIKFQKRVFNDFHTEYILSSDENKNTEFFPDMELRKMNLRIYSFLISHIIHIKIRDNVEFLILRKDGVCHTRGIFFESIFRANIWIRTPILQICPNANQLTHSGEPKLEVLAHPNKNIQFIFFSCNVMPSDDENKIALLHVFYEESNFHHLCFPLKFNSKIRSMTTTNIELIYNSGIFCKKMHENLGYHVFDENTKMLLTRFHDQERGDFLNDNCRVYTSDFSKEEFDKL